MQGLFDLGDRDKMQNSMHSTVLKSLSQKIAWQLNLLMLNVFVCLYKIVNIWSSSESPLWHLGFVKQLLWTISTYHGFNPSQQPSSISLSFSLGGMGERIRRVKTKRLIGWDTDSVIGRTEVTKKELIHCFLGQVGIQPCHKSRAPAHLDGYYLGR